MYTISCLLLIREEDLDTLAMSSSAYVYVSTKYTMPHASCVKTVHNAMSFRSFQEHLYRIAASSEAISAGLFGHWPVHASRIRKCAAPQPEKSDDAPSLDLLRTKPNRTIVLRPGTPHETTTLSPKALDYAIKHLMDAFEVCFVRPV